MLSALVTVNPDTSEGRTSWIDPILEKTPPDRHVWESSLLLYIKQNKALNNADLEAKYWWKYVVEGVEMGERVQAMLGKQSEDVP